MTADPYDDDLALQPLERADAFVFEKAGFRAYSLCGEDWRLVLSRVDVADREPRGLVQVYSAGHPKAFRDLDDLVLARTVGLFGGTLLKGLAQDIGTRIGGDPSTWLRRLDYLGQRTLREAQGAGESGVISGRPERPTGESFVMQGRMRQGRTISVYSPGSGGKTTVVDGLLVSCDTGVEVIPGWVPTRRFVVGVLDWDEGIHESRVRVHAIANAYSLSLNGYHYRRMGRPLADSADEVGRWVVENGIEVLAVSPVNRALRAANGDPGGPVFELYEVLREFGTTNILIDHVVGSAVDGQHATREYGSVAKRDSARGSYSLYQQSESPGRRVVVLRNTKPDALAPRHPPQAVRIEFDPPYPDVSGTYSRITFHEDVFAEASTAGEASSETQADKLVRILREHGDLTGNRRTLAKVKLCALGGFDAKHLRFVAHRARMRGFHVNADGDDYTLELPADG